MGRCATVGASDLQLVALKRLAAARDVLDGVLQGRIEGAPATLDAAARLVARAGFEFRLAWEIESGVAE